MIEFESMVVGGEDRLDAGTRPLVPSHSAGEISAWVPQGWRQKNRDELAPAP